MKGIFIDGDFRDISDPATNYLSLEGLTENEALTLTRFALPRGFQVVLIGEEGDKTTGGADHGEEQQ